MLDRGDGSPAVFQSGSGSNPYNRVDARNQVNAIQRAQAAGAIQNLASDCQGALTDLGVDLGGLATTATSINYISTYVDGDIRISFYGLYGFKDPTLATAFGGSRAAVLPTAEGFPSNNVFLSAAYFLNTVTNPVTRTVYDVASSQNATLVHEALHVYLGQGDSALAAYLDLGNGLSPDDASRAISLWLLGGCK